MAPSQKPALLQSNNTCTYVSTRSFPPLTLGGSSHPPYQVQTNLFTASRPQRPRIECSLLRSPLGGLAGTDLREEPSTRTDGTGFLPRYLRVSRFNGIHGSAGHPGQTKACTPVSGGLSFRTPPLQDARPPAPCANADLIEVSVSGEDKGTMQRRKSTREVSYPGRKPLTRIIQGRSNVPRSTFPNHHRHHPPAFFNNLPSRTLYFRFLLPGNSHAPCPESCGPTGH